MASLILAAFFLDIPHLANAWAHPRETSVVDGQADLLNGWTPKPTPPPGWARYGSMPQGQLFARQQENSATCGWVSGNSDEPLDCGTDVCAYYNTNTPAGFICCPTVSGNAASLSAAYCPYRSTCLDYGASGNPYTGSFEAISSDDNILSCGSQSPSCYTIGNTDTSGDVWYYYGCGTVSTSYGAYMYIKTTSGAPSSGGTTSGSPPQSSNPSSSTSPSSVQSNPPIVQSTPPSGVTNSGGATNTGSSHNAPGLSAGSTNAGATGSASKTGSSSSTSTGGPSTDVGAIAGGTVGGVAAVALIGAAIGYLVYRKRKQRVQSMPEVSQYEPYGGNYRNY